MALFDQIDGSVDVAVRAGGSFVVPYPAGRVTADYVATGATLLIHAFGTIYTSPSQFTYALGASSATITLVTVPALPVKTEIRVGLPLAAVSVGGGAVAAVDVTFTATGNISSTNVQAAIAELDAEKATTADVNALIATYVAAQDVMVFKGVIDGSANPNYPAASAGYTYRISVAGKIGGASGTNVEAGDILLCLTDGTASGTQAAVGANWSVIQTNVDGAVTLTGTQTLTNKTLTAPVINSPTGLVKADVGLSGLTLGSTFTTSGAFSLTLTATASTNVTLPTSGTLATTAQVPVKAAGSDIRTGTDDTNFATTKALVDAAAYITLTDASTVAWDMATGFNAKVTIAGNRTFGAPTNPKEGLTYTLRVIQDGTGSRTGTWNACFDWGTTGTPTLSTAASKDDLITLICVDASTPKFRAFFNKAA